MNRSILLAGIAVLAATAAQASHFRGATLIPSVSADGTLTVNTTSYWRPTFVDDVGFITVSGGVGGVSASSNVQDTSDARRTEVTEVFTATLPGAGTYDISFSNCCWVSGVPNASGGFGTSSTIVWDGSTANAPINFSLSNIQQEVPRSAGYSDNLGVTGPHSYTYDDTVVSTGMSSLPADYDIDATGTISMPLSTTSAIADNGSNTGADLAFSGEINSSDGSSVEFVWVFDGTDDAPDTNSAPSVADITVNAIIGDMIAETVTATDPDGDPVALTFDGFSGPGGAVLSSTFTDNGDDTGSFAWDSTGFTAGTYVALIQGSDGSLTDIGQITINLSKPVVPPTTPTIPLPASALLALGGLGVLGGLKLRRKR